MRDWDLLSAFVYIHLSIHTTAQRPIFIYEDTQAGLHPIMHFVSPGQSDKMTKHANSEARIYYEKRTQNKHTHIHKHTHTHKSTHTLKHTHARTHTLYF